jgi:CTP:molybdopterin cytidylyltransferase MocA
VTVAGLVLAAGEGRRLGRPKALVEVDGERLVDRAVRVLHDAGCTPVYVVAGAAPLDDVAGQATLDGVAGQATLRVVVVDNPDWATGMGSSLRRGLAAVTQDAVVVMVVDTPGIGATAVRRLLDAYAAGAAVVVATYDGAMRNPVLLTRAHFDEVSSLAVGDIGARAFLAARTELITAVECSDVADPADIDTEDDLRSTRRG